MIKYDKLFNKLRENGITQQTIRDNKIVGQSTYYQLKKGSDNITMRTIDKFCKLLNCQPCDLIEYVAEQVPESDVK